MVLSMLAGGMILAAASGRAALAQASDGVRRPFPDEWFFDGAGRPPQLKALEGKPAPPLTIESWIGASVTLAELRGQVVIVDFWATWCGPCLAAIPHNTELVRRYADQGFVLLGVHDANAGWERADGIVRDRGINYTVGKDAAGGTSAKAYAVQFWPTYVAIDRAGVVRAAGLATDRVEDAIKLLLAEPAPDPTSIRDAEFTPDFYYGGANRPSRLRLAEGRPAPELKASAWLDGHSAPPSSAAATATSSGAAPSEAADAPPTTPSAAPAEAPPEAPPDGPPGAPPSTTAAGSAPASAPDSGLGAAGAAASPTQPDAGPAGSAGPGEIAPGTPVDPRGTVAVLVFVTPALSVSLRELERVDALRRELAPQGVTFIGVCDGLAPWESMVEQARAMSVGMSLMRDEVRSEPKDEGGTRSVCATATGFGVEFAPTIVVLDRAGTIRAAGVRADRVKAVVEKLLGEQVVRSGPGDPHSVPEEGGLDSDDDGQ